jgi:hypothetical protein
MTRTLPDRCPPRHLGFTSLGPCPQRHVPQQKGFHLHQAALGVDEELGRQLDRTRLPSRADRNRALLGHVKTSMPSNPLAPKRMRRRHPKMVPEGSKETLLAAVSSARDRMVVTWLADGGFRIGELCGLHLADLHLREHAACAQCRSPHVHVCHRPTNRNRAAAKTKHEWYVQDGVIHGGLIKRASPAMIHTYFEYMSIAATATTGCWWCSCTAGAVVSRGQRTLPAGCCGERGNGPGSGGSSPMSSAIRSPPRSWTSRAAIW